MCLFIRKVIKQDCNKPSLLSTTHKILSSILLSRVTSCPEEISVEHQCGFRRNSQLLNVTFMGSCIVGIFHYISNKIQRYTVYLYLETALHVSGRTSTPHHERIQLYLQHLVFAVDAVDTFVCAPDDGWKYHPKHVEPFPDINKLCNVASCWIYIGV